MNEKSILKALTSTLILAAGHEQRCMHKRLSPIRASWAHSRRVERMVAGARESAAGAPNVVWILIDDVGYGAAGTFGGLIHTPTFDALANNGLRYTNFHTCAICAPTRSALLTGRNSASVHESGFSHVIRVRRLPRLGWPRARHGGHHRRDSARQRLQHLCGGQVWHNAG